MTLWSSLIDEARIIALNLADATTGVLNPTLRIGVTGLSRAGKTVFITALVQALREGGRLPLLEAHAQGRIIGARLEQQPDDGVPRFDIEKHLDDLTIARIWPQSTRRISELRLVIDFQSNGFIGRNSGPGTLTLDIVDYPGEWLLDLPLLGKSYAQWSAEALALSRLAPRDALARDWHAHLAHLSPSGAADEARAREAAELFTAYLRACRQDPYALSTLPPGRFLLPGDMEGSPALTFAPLENLSAEAPAGSLQAMMERRYDSYRDLVVRPFFRDHFARLDRQIVLIDALSALNAGPGAVADLERALADILSAFRVGSNGMFSALFRPRITKILFAATKADHLHHLDHNRLEAILRRLTQKAIGRASGLGSQVDVIALAAIRATREAEIKQGRETLHAISGTPLAGETIGDETFDGEADVALFPGDLPNDPDKALNEGRNQPSPEEAAIRFVRFRPPQLTRDAKGRLPLPHIRLDRALQFLIGDKLA